MSNANPYNHPDNDNPTEINPEGAKIWNNSAGKPHRDGDKPAVIYPGGTVYYYKEGKLHREGDKPAIIYPDGSAFYYKEGKLHREGDKPAIIGSDGTVEYWENGKLIRSETNPYVQTLQKYRNLPEGPEKDELAVRMDQMVHEGHTKGLEDFIENCRQKETKHVENCSN